MRIIMLAVICFGLFNCKAQSYDSLTKRVLALEADVSEINLRMKKHHREFKLGTNLFFAFAAISSASLLMYSKSSDQKGKDIYKNIAIGSGIIASAGIIIQIDSHKWFYRNK